MYHDSSSEIEVHVFCSVELGVFRCPDAPNITDPTGTTNTIDATDFTCYNRPHLALSSRSERKKTMAQYLSSERYSSPGPALTENLPRGTGCIRSTGLTLAFLRGL